MDLVTIILSAAGLIIVSISSYIFVSVIKQGIALSTISEKIKNIETFITERTNESKDNGKKFYAIKLKLQQLNSASSIEETKQILADIILETNATMSLIDASNSQLRTRVTAIEDDIKIIKKFLKNKKTVK